MREIWQVYGQLKKFVLWEFELTKTVLCKGCLYLCNMTTRGGVNIFLKLMIISWNKGVPPLLMGAKKSRLALSPFFNILTLLGIFFVI